jgi:hypothetical protein
MESGKASNSLCCKSSDVIFTQFPISTQETKRETIFMETLITFPWKLKADLHHTTFG